MLLEVPDFSLILLYGASGAGKSHFAQRFFPSSAILSSDRFRAMICDDENDQSVTSDAFQLLHQTLAFRLRQGRLTVIDATNLSEKARQPLLTLAKKFYCPVVLICLDMPLDLLLERRNARQDRHIPEERVREQFAAVEAQRANLDKIAKTHYHFRSPEELASLTLLRLDPWQHSRNDSGPFDLIGDVHGCFDELAQLVLSLGYHLHGDGPSQYATHPQGRKLVFLGDLVDRGPKVKEVISFVINTVEAGHAYCAPGNHDLKLYRKLKGNPVEVRHGLEQSLQQLEGETELIHRFQTFIGTLPSHYLLDRGRLVAVHAGIKETFIGRQSDRIWAFALYGEATGEVDAQGYPIRGNWAAQYQGTATVVYGHTPIATPTWENNTLCIDTGCVFGNLLTALRYPERELVSVPALRRYYHAGGPLLDVDAPR